MREIIKAEEFEKAASLCHGFGLSIVTIGEYLENAAIRAWNKIQDDDPEKMEYIVHFVMTIVKFVKENKNTIKILQEIEIEEVSEKDYLLLKREGEIINE